LGSVVVLFSYFPYAAATASATRIDAGLVGIALVLAPFVFVVVGFVSRNPRAPKLVLVSMGLLVLLGLSVGLISPVLGAAAGFGVGCALSLNRLDLPDLMRNRMVAVAFAVAYTLLLLVVATPAGVFTGALLPPLVVGLADEFTVWRATRQP